MPDIFQIVRRTCANSSDSTNYGDYSFQQTTRQIQSDELSLIAQDCPDELSNSERGIPIIHNYNRTEQNRTEQNRTEQNRTEQNRTEQNRTEQNRTEQNRTEQRRTKRTTHAISQIFRLHAVDG